MRIVQILSLEYLKIVRNYLNFQKIFLLLLMVLICFLFCCFICNYLLPDIIHEAIIAVLAFLE